MKNPNGPSREEQEAMLDQLQDMEEARQNTIVSTTRQVIEKKLLTALEDGKTVAAIFTEKDLNSLITALRYAEQTRLSGVPQWKEMREGLQELRDAAFSEPPPMANDPRV